MKFIFFGTPTPAVIVLNTLKAQGLLPALVITAPDKPVGRGLIIQESPVAVWAKENNIPVEKPSKLRDGILREKILKIKPDVALVFAYGKIIPKEVLEAPKKGTLNIHPSLLPLYRGPTPVESVLLAGEEKTGVTLMQIDEEMDHGPILDQKEFLIEQDETAPLLLDRLCRVGAEMFAALARAYTEGNIKPKEQDHTLATYTNKITKADAEVILNAPALELWNKYRAYYGSVGLYFFTERNGRQIRISITKAHLIDNTFVIEKVVPEGKKEMAYADFLRREK